MATRYTDVDQLLFKRWEDALSLRDAVDELHDRVRAVVEEQLSALTTELVEQDLLSNFHVKDVMFWVWPATWAKKNKDGGVVIAVHDFIPAEFGRSVGAHPSIWVNTVDFASLRTRESAEDFGKALRAAVTGDLQKKWNHSNVELDSRPLGMELLHVSDGDRLRMVQRPDELVDFLRSTVLSALVEMRPAIDGVLAKMTPK